MGGLPYPLLSDFHPKGQVSQAMGVWDPDLGASQRAIFLVDKEGVIRYKRTWPRGRPDTEEILQEVDKLE